MYLTWVTFAGGIFVLFVLPIIVFYFNKKKYPLGWLILLTMFSIIVVGNVIERIINQI
jgi:DMSO reductase anchor subunit